LTRFVDGYLGGVGIFPFDLDVGGLVGVHFVVPVFFEGLDGVFVDVEGKVDGRLVWEVARGGVIGPVSAILYVVVAYCEGDQQGEDEDGGSFHEI
jgi:hypothetical protein